jgi:hypothetical protein
MCCEQVSDGGQWPRFHNCTRKAKVTRDGKEYCGVHDPVARQEKFNESYKKHKARVNREAAMMVLGGMAPKMLELLKMAVVHIDALSRTDIDPEYKTLANKTYAMIEEAEKLTV